MMAAAAFTPGAGLAALVRRQLRCDRGLASHAAARGELSSCAARHRIAAGRRQPNRVRRRRTRHDGVRRAPSRLARRTRRVPGATRRHSGRRAHADLRSAGRREDAAVPRAVGALALGQRSHRPAARRIGDVRAARHAVPTPRHAPRSARLPVAHGPLRRARVRADARAHGPRAVRQEPRCEPALGSRAPRGRADGVVARTRGVARAALGRVRRHVLCDGRRDARAGHRPVYARRSRGRPSFTSGAPRRRTCRCSRACCI